MIIEDYLAKNFDKKNNYSDYEGAQFSQLFKRQRELPFGSKLQNHALNNRMNSEFEKFFPTSGIVPIMRDQETNRYWINENLLKVNIVNKQYNIGKTIIQVIDEYVKIKQDSFQRFISQCEMLQSINDKSGEIEASKFIESLLAPNADARLFEIVSYSILKYFYIDTKIYWGYSLEHLNEDPLKLYKTGRTNANDGGIDFVMKPLGKFFQVTETLDFKKYFLDIEKLEKYPITFVVKTDENIDSLKQKLKSDALKTYVVKNIVNKYLSCIEELINIPHLVNCFTKVCERGDVRKVLDEIVLQSKVELNVDEE